MASILNLSPQAPRPTVASQIAQTVGGGLAEQLQKGWQEKRKSDQLRSILSRGETEEGKRQDYSPEQLVMIESSFPGIGKMLMAGQQQQQKAQELSKTDQEYVKGIQSAFVAGNKTNKILDSVLKDLDKAAIGPLTISKFDPAAQGIRSQVGTLFKIYSDLFKGGRITDQKFKYIKEDLLPSLWDTKAVFKQKIKKFKEMVEEDVKKGNLLLSLRKQHGRTPQNIFDLLESAEMDSDKSISLETPQEEAAAEIPVGTRAQKGNQIIEMTETGWRVVK